MQSHVTQPLKIPEAKASQFSNGNPFFEMASKVAAELQRPTPGLTERRGVGGGLPRSADDAATNDIRNSTDIPSVQLRRALIR